MNSPFPLFRSSTTTKVLFITILTLFLLVPLGMIENLIEERATTRARAEADISRTWGGPQTIGGPVVVVPISYRANRPRPAEDAVTIRDELYFLPEELSIRGQAATDVLERGIYEIPVYSAEFVITGSLRPPAFGSGTYPEEFETHWDEASVALPVSDVRSINDRVTIDVDGMTAEFGPGGKSIAGFGQWLVVPLSELGLEAFDTPRDFSLEVGFNGVESLSFLPLGDITTVEIASDWSGPSFNGDYLPAGREVGESGFNASWRVLAMGRGLPESFSRSSAGQYSMASFGVTLMPSLSVHQVALKASKYGVLFVGLSFVAFFLFELLRNLRLHAMHYLSVGMANVVFYLLLLAIAEHIGFGSAYLLSASASVLLISGYAASILHGMARALPIAALLSLTYLQLYIVVNAEDFAVLIGAITLFVLLAGFMYLTRNVDWFELDAGLQRHR